MVHLFSQSTGETKEKKTFTFVIKKTEFYSLNCLPQMFVIGHIFVSEKYFLFCRQFVFSTYSFDEFLVTSFFFISRKNFCLLIQKEG